jgi:ATP:ADP antiporter, AAA family
MNLRAFQWTHRELVWPSFAWFFCILGGYYVIRPVREAMGVASGKDSLNWLFLATFVAMIIAVPIYAWLVAKLPRKRLVAVIYHFFAINLLLFWWLFQNDSEVVKLWVARAFFVWTSVFSLYATSVFWSVLADVFNSQNAKQAFGFIAAGGTIGAIAGSITASFLASRLETHHLLLVPIVLLELGLIFAAYLHRRATQNPVVLSDIADIAHELNSNQNKEQNNEGQPTGGGVIDGVVRVARSPYLLAICLSLFLGQLCATHIYLQQATIVGDAIPDSAGRTKLFADMNLYVQILTLVLQTSIAGLLTKRIGLAIALAATPIAYTIAFATLGVSPSLGVFVIADVIRRGLAYGVAVPAREILFTVVSRDDKYKSKGFIDTVILRGGDAISSQILASAGYLFASAAIIQLAMVPIAGIWVAINLRLARWQRSLVHDTTPDQQVR